MAESLARQLARFVARLSYDDLPSAVVEKVKVCLLHGVGIGLAGLAEPVSRPALNLVRDNEAIDQGGAAVIGTNLRTTAGGAAFANSVLLHARLQEDAYRTASHPGSTIIPAGLAVAEMRGATGRDLLVALVAGYEAMAAAMADTVALTTPRGFRATPLYGGFGAAAAAGKLLGLDEEAQTTAFALAATLTGGTTGGMGSGMSLMVAHTAWATRNGLLAAQLAAAGSRIDEAGLEAQGGFYSAFAGLAEAPDSAAHLGKEWRIHEVTLKRYPSAMFNQPVIHLAVQLARQYDLQPDQIARAELQMADFEIRYPSNESKARLENLSSPTLMAALGLAERRGPTSPSPKADPPSAAARALHAKIDWTGGRPGLSPRLIVTLKDGTVHQGETHDAADFRFGLAEDAAIVRSLQPAMPIDVARLDRLIEDCARLEQLPAVASVVPTVS